MLLNDLQVNATQFLIEGISDFANTSVNLEFEKQKKTFFQRGIGYLTSLSKHGFEHRLPGLMAVSQQTVFRAQFSQVPVYILGL